MRGGEELRRLSSPDSKATSCGVGLPRPWSPDVLMAAGGGPCGRGDAPSSPNLKAAGSDIAPSSPAFLATRELITADSDAWKEFFSSLALSSPHRMAAGSHPYGAEASSTKPLLLERLRRQESDEEIEDEEDPYFDVLVDKFILAAYPQGMNVVVATRPGQQEAATTPGASAHGMEARHARQVAESEGDEAVVSTRSGEGSLVAKIVRTRMVARERFTWKYQTTEDGPNGLIVLSHVKRQPLKDSCTPTSTASVMESNLRVQLNKDVLLSMDHMIHLFMAGHAKFPNEKGVKRLFLMLQDEGVMSEEDYRNQETATSRDVVRYRIIKDCNYLLDNPDHMKHALHKLRNGGPLLGVIRISKNYDNCYKLGHVYKYDPDLVDRDEKDNPISVTHAVCVISFAIEDNVPFLECQDSHGDTSRNKGFLKIDVTSLSQLWSIIVA